MQKYELKNVLNVEEAAPVASLFSLDQIQLLCTLCMSNNFENLPPCVSDTLNATSENNLLYNALSHNKWKDNTIPVYDIIQSHFTAELYDELELDPDEPETFFNFFWQDEDLKKIVYEIHSYIDKKIGGEGIGIE